jgi:hypothetical protein
MTALGLPAAALALVLATTTLGPASAPAAGHEHAACTPTVSDPDPTDCPFCGGNPSVHIRALWAIQKESARVFALRLL